MVNMTFPTVKSTSYICVLWVGLCVATQIKQLFIVKYEH